MNITLKEAANFAYAESGTVTANERILGLSLVAAYECMTRLKAGWQPGEFTENNMGLPTGWCWQRGYGDQIERDPMSPKQLAAMKVIAQ